MKYPHENHPHENLFVVSNLVSVKVTAGYYTGPLGYLTGPLGYHTGPLGYHTGLGGY